IVFIQYLKGKFKTHSNKVSNNKHLLLIFLLLLSSQYFFDASAITTELKDQTFTSHLDDITISGELNEYIITNCTFTGINYGGNGGAIRADVSNNGKLLIKDSQFIQCKENREGGAIYLNINNEGQVILSNSSFDRCEALLGGVIYADIISGGNLLIDGQCKFTECKADFGGDICAYISGLNSLLTLDDGVKFEDCTSNKGGGIFIEIRDQASCIINKVLFKDCSAYGGGGILVYGRNQMKQTFNGTQFINCEAQNTGGGMEVSLSTQNSILELIDILFENCTAFGDNSGGGGLFIETWNLAQLIISGTCLFINCSADNGGGIFAQIDSGGKLTIDGYCKFTECKVGQSGGGIQAEIKSENTKLELINFLFENCTGIAAYLNNNNGGNVLISNSSFIQCGNGGMRADLQHQNSILELINLSFKNCNSGQGGGLTLYVQDGSLAQINGLISFNNCMGFSGGQMIGGGIYAICNGTGSQILIAGKLEFEDCKSNRGGGMYIETHNFATVIINQLLFKECWADYGGGLFAHCQTAQLTFTGQVLFQNSWSYNSGGGCYLRSQNGSVNFNSDEQILFDSCHSQVGGGMFMHIYNNGLVSTNKIHFDNCSGLGTGGLYNHFRDGGQICIVNQCVFTDCRGSTSRAGGFLADMNDGIINIKGTTFDSCTCNQLGSGGAIVVLQSSSSIIQITNSSFINCKALLDTSDLRYGWGGAIFIQTNITAENLNKSNFIMTDLVFIGCSAVNSIGNNIHIQSTNTYNTGIAIAAQYLITVKDTPNLYTSSEYSDDYMGIDQSKIIDGKEPYSF
ncbi:MAG: hypothetical protein EZS28_032378, partial [Streblomastix strix]